MKKEEWLELIGLFLNWPILALAAWKVNVEPSMTPLIHALFYLIELLTVLSACWRVKR